MFDISSMNKEHPELSKLLKIHDVKVKIFKTYKGRPDELLEVETLIRDLERLGCRGLEDKFNDVTAEKFDSTVSELTVAEILLNNNYDTELLSDDDERFKIKKGHEAKSPDIICTRDTSTTYIEVVRLNDSSFKDVVDLIQEQVGDFVRCLPYRIDIHLKDEPSLPKIKKEDKNKQKQSVLDSLEIFKKSFSEAMQPQVPLNLPSDAGAFTFVLKKIESEQGYFCIISTCFDVPTELIEYLEKYDIDKKNKAHDFPIEQRKNPFIIAIDLHMREIKDESVHRLLYGDVVVFCSSTFANDIGISSQDYIRWTKEEWEKVITETHKRDSWKKIERAQSNGWSSFLIEKSLIPNNDQLSYIDKNNEGIFVSDKMEDVSAVLLIDHNRKCFLYPNPFCREEINNPKIINFINMTEDAEG